MDKPVAAPAAGAKEKVEKQARQLAYDTRYKVKQSMKAKAGGRIDPAAMRKAFISQLAKSPSAPAIKARAKQMLMGEGYIDVKDLVQEHASKALFKVFVEHHKKDENGNTIPHEGEEISEGKVGEKTYKVRVTDKKTGNSYVRMASRAKIADLRNNPNISSVEMTGYGEPTKSEKLKGKQTAKAKSGKGLDPVGKEDGDVNNDGKKDSTDSYLMNRRKAIGKAMAKEDKVWAGFKELIEKKEEKEKKITGEGVDNKKLIKVFPDEVKEEMEKKEEPKEDQGLKQKQRKANMAKKQVLMKKMQAVRMGAGDQIMASHEPEGEIVEDKDFENKVKSQIKSMDSKSEADYEAAARASADASARRRRQKENAAKVRRSEMGAARRREKRNELRRQGKYKGPMESVEVDEGMLVNVAKGVESGVKKFNKFDDKVTKAAVKRVKKVGKKVGMAALRGTAGAVGGAIKGAGQGAMKGIKKGLKEEEMMKDQVVDKKKKKEEDDPRSMPTKVNLVKNKMRAMGLNMQYDHGSGLVDAYMQVHKGQQIDEILEKGTKGKVEFHSGRSDKENRQVMKTKRKTVNNPKGRKIHQSPMGKTIGKLNQVKSKQYDAEKKGDMKTASKMMDRRKKLSGTLYDKTGNFYDRADND